MNAMRPRAILQLTGALTFRGLREQGSSIFVNPLVLAIVFVVMVCAALYFPIALTPPTRHAIDVGAANYGGSRQTGIALAVMLNQAPYLVALFAASAGSTLAQSLVGQESSRGGVELLLSGPYRLAEVLMALLLVSFVLTAFSWLALTLVGIAGSAALLAVLHAGLPVSAGRVALLLLFPLPLAYLSNLIAVILSIHFPHRAQNRGSGFDFFQMFAVAPSLIVLLIVSFWPSLNPFGVAAAAMAAGIAGSVVALVVVGRSFDPSSVLAS